MKNRLLGVTAFLAFAASSAIGTDAPVELPARTVGSPGTIHVATISTCADARAFLKNRLFYLEKEIGVQYHQREAWRAFSEAALDAQKNFESVCGAEADPGDPGERLANGKGTFPSAPSDSLQAFDEAAKAFVDALTPAQQQKFSDALWTIVRSEGNRKRSEFECCTDRQFIVAMLISVAQVSYAKG